MCWSLKILSLGVVFYFLALRELKMIRVEQLAKSHSWNMIKQVSGPGLTESRDYAVIKPFC